MTFIRGHQFCFDRWERAGNPGWGYEALLPYFKKSERNEMGETEYRGGDGPLAVSLCTDPHAGHKAFLAAVAQQQYKVDARYDFNVPTPVNVAGYYQKNILDGKRHSVADAFLTPALSRPNLEVRSQCQATKIVFEGKKAVGIEYLRDGKPETARASRQIVLCRRRHRLTQAADAVGHRARRSLEVARHSGHRGRAGRREELPGSPEAVDPLERQDGAAGLNSHRRACSCDRIRRSYGDPPDLQFYVGRGLETPDRFITITVSLVFPKSRGEVTLAIGGSAGARRSSAPTICRNKRTSTRSCGACKLARWFGEADAYADLKGEELLPGPSMKSDADLAAFARRDSDTIYHGAGTCKMGPGTDPAAVVDPSLRVRGVDGLRVADGSIMPEVVNATTNAACVMIGEKASDLVRNA